MKNADSSIILLQYDKQKKGVITTFEYFLISNLECVYAGANVDHISTIVL